MTTGRLDKILPNKKNKVKLKSSEANESKAQPIILKKNFHLKLPASIINISINRFLKTSEAGLLAQTNRFFSQTLSQTLLHEKNKIKKYYDDTISIDRLFSDIDPTVKMTVGEQKAHAIGKVITQFVNEEKSQEYYTNDHDPDTYSKLVLNHAFDLDQNNRSASQLGGYIEDDRYCEWIQYFPYLKVGQTQTGKDRLIVKGLKLNTDEVEYLAETYRRYYSNLNVHCGQLQCYKRKKLGYISFDLENFLKVVLPVILNFSPKPVLSNDLRSLSDKVQRRCYIS